MTAIAMPARTWGDEPKPEAPRPRVLVSSRDGAPVPWVAAAARLAGAAEAAGWSARQTYALAEVPATSRTDAYRLATVAVRLERRGQRAWAVWCSRTGDGGPWRFADAQLATVGIGVRCLGARALSFAVAAPAERGSAAA